MKTRMLLVALLLTAPAWADDWQSKLSPRMREAIRPMLAPDWSPKKEVEMSGRERQDLKKALPRVQDHARDIFQSLAPGRAVLVPATPTTEVKPQPAP